MYGAKFAHLIQSIYFSMIFIDQRSNQSDELSAEELMIDMICQQRKTKCLPSLLEAFPAAWGRNWLPLLPNFCILQLDCAVLGLLAVNLPYSQGPSPLIIIITSPLLLYLYSIIIISIILSTFRVHTQHQQLLLTFISSGSA